MTTNQEIAMAKTSRNAALHVIVPAAEGRLCEILRMVNDAVGIIHVLELLEPLGVRRVVLFVRDVRRVRTVDVVDWIEYY